MKRKLSLLLLTSFSLYAHQNEESSEVKKITFNDINQHAQYWVEQMPTLTQEEYNLLTNLLYFDFLAHSFESAARAALISTYSQTIIMNKQLVVNENDSKKTALDNAAKLQKLCNELLPVRMYSGKSLKACLDEIEKSNFKTLKEIVVNLQQYKQAIIGQFIKQDQESIMKLVKNGSTALDAYLDKLNSCKETLSGILKNKNPYLKEGTEPSTGNLDLALAAADTTLGLLNEIALNAVALKSMSADILNINSLISCTFCNVLNESVSKNKMGPIQIMFDENGLIKKENRDENIVMIDNKFSVHKKHYTAL